MARQSTKQENEIVYVLHTYPFKETSLIVEIFSKVHGRISIVAKGARRPRSLVRGMLQSFQSLQATWSGQGEMKTLHSIDWCDALLQIEGDALICGFYINELLMRLLPKEDPHEKLFDFYHQTMELLSMKNHLSVTLRRFELKLLQELGYELPLLNDENGEPIKPNKIYNYEVAYGPSETKNSSEGVSLIGKTLIDMAGDDYKDPTTEMQSKQLMRYLIGHYIGEKPLNSKKLFLHLEGELTK
jgi:DNA repair protein RecO (recombination protein O)|tara:strand:- start:472 stop:1200 length:729 start_codon:yes stop_codon:yes gene_type:complete